MSEREIIAAAICRVANITAHGSFAHCRTEPDDPVWLALADRVIANRKVRK